jgi:DNA mismatch endonuclease, patch repair protein
MPDMFDPAKRSEIMSKIRSKNTVAELTVFRYLRKNGVYFQKHYTRVPGKPDIALPRKKKAVFIDGDFWHGRNFDRLIKSDNSEYWTKKIARNIARDSEINRKLKEGGWTVLRIWETDIIRKKTQDESLESIRKFLQS